MLKKKKKGKSRSCAKKTKDGTWNPKMMKPGRREKAGVRVVGNRLVLGGSSDQRATRGATMDQ